MISKLAVQAIRRTTRKFSGDRHGAAALEFALVGLPFLAVLFAILELALDFVLFSQVDYVNSRALLRIRSGEVTIQNLSAEEFKEKHLCPYLTLLPCEPLVVNVLTMKEWWTASGWNNPDAWRPGQIDPSKALFCPGGAADVVFMQLAYPVPFGSVLWAGDKNISDGKRYYLSTTAFRNDPFGVPSNVRAGC